MAKEKNNASIADMEEAALKEIGRRMEEEFHEAYLNRAKTKTGERAAYISAIHIACGAAERLGVFSDEEIDWFLLLAEHLKDLELGIVHPVLDCPMRSKALPTSEWHERAGIVNAVELLHASGMKYKPAAQRVILHMKLQGCSEKQVLSWCAEFKKGRVKNRAATRNYETAMKSIRGRSAEQLQRWVTKLELLDD
jgi:hypothetical protein